MQSLSLIPCKAPLFVIKSNLLIEANYDLSPLQHKMILLAISHIHSHVNNIVKIRLSDFCDLLETTTDRYSEVRKRLKELRKQDIEITRYGENNEMTKDLVSGWISNFEFENGIIEIEFPQKLMPHLIDLKDNYTKYDFVNVKQLSSKHAIRFFEFLKSKEFKKGKTIYVEYNQLREMFRCENKLLRYFDFKKTVLIPAQNEIQDKTDIVFDLQEVKSGRDVIGFNIKIYENSQVLKLRKYEQVTLEKLSYYGSNSAIDIFETYSQKSKDELAVELSRLIDKKYNASLPTDVFMDYSAKTLRDVLFKIVDDDYKDVDKPVVYFKKVLQEREEMFTPVNS